MRRQEAAGWAASAPDDDARGGQVHARGQRGGRGQDAQRARFESTLHDALLLCCQVCMWAQRVVHRNTGPSRLDFQITHRYIMNAEGTPHLHGEMQRRLGMWRRGRHCAPALQPARPQSLRGWSRPGRRRPRSARPRNPAGAPHSWQSVDTPACVHGGLVPRFCCI